MGNLLLFVIICSLANCVGALKDTCQKPSNSSCLQVCANVDNTCPKMNCAKAKVQNCKLICLKSELCGTLECDSNVNKCVQICLDPPKETTLTCSSDTCDQSCSGKNTKKCVMECTDKVKTCKQLCSDGAKCTLSCGKGTQCDQKCQPGTNCVIKGQAPTVAPHYIKSKCDKDKCEKNCTGNCTDIVLSCSDGTKECNLLCENGCKMECGKTVTTCKQQCRGKISCKHSCESKACNFQKVGSNLATDHFRIHTIICILMLPIISLLLVTN